MEAISYEVAENGILDIMVKGYRVSCIKCFAGNFAMWYVNNINPCCPEDTAYSFVKDGGITLSEMTLFVNHIVK